MKNPTTTTIEITDTHVKLLQAKMLRGHRAVSSCEVRPIHNPTDEEIAGILAEITQSRNIPPDELTVVIPRRFTILS